MQFWKLEGTDYGNDYKTSFVNGQIEHPYSLPVVQCKVCRQRISEDFVLPYKCPVGLRKKLTDPDDVGMEEFKVIAKQAIVAAKAQGFSASVVQPGCSLQPAFLDIGSKPTADFLWPSFSALVSPRIRKKMESLKLRDVAFGEVKLRKVGKKSAKLRPPIPSTGEPEDIVKEVPTKKFPKTGPEYFEVCIYGKSALHLEGSCSPNVLSAAERTSTGAVTGSLL